jgi:hypothetical protein
VTRALTPGGPENRDGTGRFRPGQSGNPGGRPRGLAQATRDLLGDDGRAIVNFWMKVMMDEHTRMGDRLEASKLLAERGWGKSLTSIPLEHEAPSDLDGTRWNDAAEQFDAEVRRLSALRNRRLDERRA